MTCCCAVSSATNCSSRGSCTRSRATPTSSLAGPREVYLSGVAQMAENREKLEEVLRCLYPARSLPPRWGFFAGTMFWARPEFFRPFSKATCIFVHSRAITPETMGSSRMRSNGCSAPLRRSPENGSGSPKSPATDPSTVLSRSLSLPGNPGRKFLRVLKGRALQMSGHMPLRRDGLPVREGGWRDGRFGRPSASRPCHRNFTGL